jgi:hypothetical protein
MALLENEKIPIGQFFTEVRNDKFIVVFFLNALLVVISYYVANAMPSGYSFLKFLKTGLLIYSVFDMILYNFNHKEIAISGVKMVYIFLFLFLILLTIPFSVDPSESFSRYVTFIGGIIYLALFSKYISSAYTIRKVSLIFCIICFVAYLLPVLIALIKLPFLASVQFKIYGDKAIATSLGFMSNNFGWSGAIVFLSAFTMLSNFDIKTKGRIFFMSFMLFSIFLILVSQSRSSLVIMAIALILIIIGAGIKISYKFLLAFTILSILFINNEYNLIDLGTSRFNDKLVGNRVNFNKEIRVIILDNTRDFFYFNQTFFLHGFGLGVFVKAYQKYINAANDMDMHNTYAQLLYECGIFPFAVFVGFFLLPSVWKYFLYLRKYLIFLPFIILPYFENNLNSGQFVFFPFFFTLFFVSSFKRQRV